MSISRQVVRTATVLLVGAALALGGMFVGAREHDAQHHFSIANSECGTEIECLRFIATRLDYIADKLSGM